MAAITQLHRLIICSPAVAPTKLNALIEACARPIHTFCAY
jgi:hypothetical protein